MRTRLAEITPSACKKPGPVRPCSLVSFCPSSRMTSRSTIICSLVFLLAFRASNGARGQDYEDDGLVVGDGGPADMPSSREVEMSITQMFFDWLQVDELMLAAAEPISAVKSAGPRVLLAIPMALAALFAFAQLIWRSTGELMQMTKKLQTMSALQEAEKRLAREKFEEQPLKANLKTAEGAN
mmetsp:Transcript_154865/g.285459  ORF Transcript_154865/g.285459 Transcript_154865/m.285459 type:complete len:183 (+) Transcript_154865:1-549(+)